jgi:MFS transporter, DHA1 family, tetracycline resistance protein
MNSHDRRISFFTILFSEFIDYAGVAIAYPLFAYMLFEPSLDFLPAHTSNAVRGMWLGILLALHPLLQFISAPIFGMLSDLCGRKKWLCWTRILAVLGYIFAYFGCLFESLPLLAVYRICVGTAAGNCSIISAIVADITLPENRAKNYGLLNMAFGVGFTLGPFLGGLIFHYVNLSTPFLVAMCLVVLNWILISWQLKETLTTPRQGKIGFFASISQIKQALTMRRLRFLFLTLLVFSFGWSLFTEFIPVFLLDHYAMTPALIGGYYGYIGFFYAISAGFLIYPFLRWLTIEKALPLSMLLAGIYLGLFLMIEDIRLLWLYLPLSQFFLAFAYPVICAMISNRVTADRQGEVMGIYQSVIALALTITPLLGGLVVGNRPYLAILISGILMIIAALIHTLFKDEIPILDLD